MKHATCKPCSQIKIFLELAAQTANYLKKKLSLLDKFSQICS